MRQLVQDPRSGEVQVIDSPDPVADGGRVLIRTTWSLISAGTEQTVAETASKSLLGKARDRPDLARKVVEKARREGLGAAKAAVRARLRQDKGHAAILQASFEFFRNGGEPPIPYDRLLETTRATLLARESLHRTAAGAVTLDDRA